MKSPIDLNIIQYIQFFKSVCIYLNIHNWKIEFNGDNYCWKSKRIITINPRYDGDVRQIILHEISHIETARFSNQKHNFQFWKYLEYLTKKFLQKNLDKHQIKHKQYMTKGIYKLCYE